VNSVSLDPLSHRTSESIHDQREKRRKTVKTQSKIIVEKVQYVHGTSDGVQYCFDKVDEFFEKCSYEITKSLKKFHIVSDFVIID